MSKKTFIGYKDRIDYTEEMSLEEVGILFNAILCYQNGKEIGELGNVKFVWSKIKKEMDADKEKYEKICETNSEKGKKHGGNQYTKRDVSWKAQKKAVEQNGTEWNRMEQNGTNGTHSDSDSEYTSNDVYKEICVNKLTHKESESGLNNSNSEPADVSRGEIVNGMEIPQTRIDKYGNSMIEDFTAYRGECNAKGVPKRKMQKTWSLGGRLATWKKNADTNFGRIKIHTIQDYENDIGLFRNEMKKDYQGIKQKVGIDAFKKLSEKARHRAFENKVL